MKTKLTVMAAVAALMAAPGLASATVLFSSDMSTGAGFSGGSTSADDLSTFGYDYSAMGIPAPPGGSDTIGLRLEANTADAASGAVAVWSDATFTGIHQLSFDAWGNYSTLGGSSEFFGGGLAHDQASVNRPGVGAGSWLLMTTDGFSARDYRMYKDGQEQFAASTQYNVDTNNNSNPTLAGHFPSVDISAFDPPQTGQTGATSDGAAGFQWLHVVLTSYPALGIVEMEINGLLLGVNGSAGTAAPTEGAISFTHYDSYGSVAAPFAFSIIDNVEVTDVPEPATMALLALGGVALLRRRR